MHEESGEIEVREGTTQSELFSMIKSRTLDPNKEYGWDFTLKFYYVVKEPQ